mgnify:CR=1 FL=1
MLFPTFTFFIFFVLVLILNWQLKTKPALWRIFLLLTSYFFYAAWSLPLTLLLFLVSVLNFYTGKIIEWQVSEKKKWIMGGAVALNLLVLAFFKYYNFFRESAEALFKVLGFSPDIFLLNILLPIGLSFYILRAISYNIDIFRGRIKSEKSMLDFLIYIAFFPQLFSGPIMRPAEFLPQLKNGGAKTIDNAPEYLSLILGGLFKKVVIASYLTVNLVDDAFSVPQNHSALFILLAIYAYAIVIYCDFSGYSDLAIGVAGLMGFKSPRNFNTPYLAISFQDFWQRWHITLSNWLRDYVYIPLGGNRKGELRRKMNAVFTMLASGLWHGVGLHFVFWGLLHGAGLVLSRAKPQASEKPELKLSRKITLFIEKFSVWFITFNAICFSWVFFRSETIKDGLLLLKQLFNFRAAAEPIPLYVIYFIFFGFILFFAGNFIQKFFIAVYQKLSFGFQIVLVSAIVILILKLGPDIIPPFIYFKF